VSAPGTQAATPPKAQKTQPTLFSLSVARLGDKATVYVFDQPTLAIGRGRECDLRLEHDGFSRRQVILQRSVTSTGSPRFRLIPQKTSNPTYVNGQPLVEGAVKSGDVIAVADVRITFTRGKAEDEVVAARRRRKRALLMAATVVMVAAFVSTLISARSSVAADTRLTQPQNDLLRDTRGFLCAGTAECATRAREAYHTGKRFLSQSMSDLSYPYRAAVEFQRAMRFRDQSGKPLPEISDVDRYLAETRSWLETEFRDGQFRLSHAMLDNDMQRCADESAYLARILPDENHPYRVKLDDYRRRLPPPRDF
jgi:pSer/pThr/pTyr-binding forkhead associated (FHA) protein